VSTDSATRGFIKNIAGRITSEYAKPAPVDESRKRVIGIMASIIAARKLANYDGAKRVPATMSAIADAVRWAEEILKEIDTRWSGRPS